MHGGVEVQLHAFITSALDGDDWSDSRHSHFTPREKLCIRLCEPHSWTAPCGESRQKYHQLTHGDSLDTPVNSMRFLAKSSISLFVFVMKSSLQDCAGVECRLWLLTPPPLPLLAAGWNWKIWLNGFDLSVGDMHNQNLQRQQGSIKRDKMCHCEP
jgi:hypothetical protein